MTPTATLFYPTTAFKLLRTSVELTWRSGYVTGLTGVETRQALQEVYKQRGLTV